MRMKYLNIYPLYHLNPVRAGMVEHCKDYPWSSYPAFGGYNKSPGMVGNQLVCCHFSEKIQIKRKKDTGTLWSRFRIKKMKIR